MRFEAASDDYYFSYSSFFSYVQDRLRQLYNDWLDSDNQTYTKAGNVRAPSRTEICEMVIQAWGSIPEEMIAKSFSSCGQLKDGNPENITCMKEGHPAAKALEEVQKFWNFTPDEFRARKEMNDLPSIEEADEEEDPTIIDDTDDEDIEENDEESEEEDDDE